MTEEQIRVVGDHDEKTIEQLRRCVSSAEGARGVLCADGHLGYSQPIGGAVAYPEHVSPSGVGYDIGCIAAGTPVTSEDGWARPIEAVPAGAPATCWDGDGLRRIDPCLGAVDRGVQPVVRVALAGGREIVCTPDHELRTKLGWKRADELEHGEAVAVVPFVGLPYEAPAARTGLPEDPRMLAALVRVLAYAMGDGHLTARGHRVALSTSVPEDAVALRDDLIALGLDPSLDVRERGGRIRTQHVIRVDSAELHGLLHALGCPVGRKATAWTADPCPWLFALPAWVRAHFLSSFASAEATTPTIVAGRLANLAIKQAGTEPHAITVLERLFASLGFRTSLTVSGTQKAGIKTWCLQLVGGEEEQLRFLREVGFCRAVEKRRAAAAVLSVVAQRQAEVARRTAAVAEGRELVAAGTGRIRDIVAEVSLQHDVPPALIHHGIYGRGTPRVPEGFTAEPDATNEVAWLPVRAVVDAGTAQVLDVATGDEAQSFLAGGVVVHNCGNKAAKTNIRAEDLKPDLARVMDDVVRTIEFGVGRRNAARVDHPVIDEIKEAAFEPQRGLAKLAAEQLGTVGSGNHYCDVVEDEDGWVWVGVHFGSRGFGHKTASGFLAMAQGLPFDGRAKEGEMSSPPVLFKDSEALGEAYVAAMDQALRYAYAGRDVVVDQMLQILGAEAVDEVHNNHNDMRRETHDGTDYWVVRKGCTPAFAGQRGFVGASMGEPSVILEGVDSGDAHALLHSTVHGAGRVMSRTKAAGRLRKRWVNNVRDDETAYETEQEALQAPGATKARKVRVREGGAIDFRAVHEELRRQGIELRGGAADEAPGAYKRLSEVLGYHAGTVRVLHTLTPLGVAMAGEGTFDPYKD